MKAHIVGMGNDEKQFICNSDISLEIIRQITLMDREVIKLWRNS